MNHNEKKQLYEDLIQSVAKIVKKSILEAADNDYRGDKISGKEIDGGIWVSKEELHRLMEYYRNAAKFHSDKNTYYALNGKASVFYELLKLGKED